MIHSLQGRLGIGLIFTLVVSFVLQWWLVSASVRTVAEGYVESRLDHDADTLLTAISFQETGELFIEQARVDGIYQKPFSGHYYQVFFADKIYRSRSLWDQELHLPSDFLETAHIDGPQGHPLFIERYQFKKKGHDLTVVLAEDQTSLQAGLRRFQWRYAFVSCVVLALIIGFQIWVVRRSLKPLETVRYDIKQLEQGDKSQLSEDVPLEIKPLVSEFNRLLDVMQQRLSRSRTALGNLAHALKTPLTVLSRLGDDENIKQHPELNNKLLSQTDIIRRLMDQQLKKARLAGASAPGLHFRVYDEIAPLVKTLEQLYRDKGLSIDFDVPKKKIFAGDREDLLELFGNLLDNACKWAKSKITLRVEDSEGLVFYVEDDGPGCSPEKRQQLIQRGVRVDESTLGHGLGLAIVKDIVDQYGGKLILGQSEVLAGFRVEVSLPGR